jgi:hypothetical protein
MGARKIPRGCFAVHDWNEDVLVVDPKAPVRPFDRVLVFRPDDLRIRIPGTYVPRRGTADRGTVRIRTEQGQDAGAYHEFDRELVAIAKIVRTVRNRR